jgi:hypothetical protein
MKMACYLCRVSNDMGLVAQEDAVDCKLVPLFAAAEFGRFRIMVSANPDPFLGKRAERAKRAPVGIGHAITGTAIMKAVAEANDPLRPVSFDDASEAYQRVVAVERRDEPASCSRVGALFQMQI